jgi:hypothetical protein
MLKQFWSPLRDDDSHRSSEKLKNLKSFGQRRYDRIIISITQGQGIITSVF